MRVTAVALPNNFSAMSLHSHCSPTCGIQPFKNHDGEISLALLLGALLQDGEHLSGLWDPRSTLQGETKTLAPIHPYTVPAALADPCEIWGGEGATIPQPPQWVLTSRRRSQTAGRAAGRAQRRASCGPRAQLRSITARSLGAKPMCLREGREKRETKLTPPTGKARVIGQKQTLRLREAVPPLLPPPEVGESPEHSPWEIALCRLAVDGVKVKGKINKQTNK